jgi:predicted flap endonuclease-1-like 5' DNA nuclease
VIWHFLEVWLLLLAMFAVGCVLGALLHVGLAAGRAAIVQDAVAAAVGEGIDRLKWRLGIIPDWRPEFRRSRPWPDLDRGLDAGEAVTEKPGRRSWADDGAPPAEAWTDDGDWQDDGADEHYDYEEEAFTEADSAQPEDEDDRAEFGETDMMRPAGLSEPRAGVPDNLQRIWGIGKRNEALLNSLGIYHFSQIAAWTPAEARWVAARLAFPERLERDNWIGQAIVLATGGDPSTVSPSNRLKTLEPDDR